MAQLPEAKFTSWFTRSLPHDWHSQRIETTTGRGVPDMNICSRKTRRGMD